MKAKTLALAGAVSALVAGSASADILGSIVREVENGIEGTFTYDVFVELSDAGDTINAIAGSVATPININAVGGTFYQDAFGNALPPNGLLFDGFPDVEFDSFFTFNAGQLADLPGGNADELTTTPGFGDFVGGTNNYFEDDGAIALPNTNEGNTAWDNSFGVANEDSGNFEVWVMRISVVADARGDGNPSVNGSFLASSSNTDDMEVAFDSIPAPGALALLGMAGLVGSRRRRK